MNKLFNVLIVGLGKIGVEYDLDNLSTSKALTHSKVFDVHESFNLVGAVDIDQTKINKFQIKYKKPGFTNLKKALSILKPDIVVVCTPTEKLINICMNIVRTHDVKLILIEKPMSFDLEKAKQLTLYAKDQGIDIFVNYMRISDPFVYKIKQKITKSKLFYKGVVVYSQGVFNCASHFINLLEYWFGNCQNVNVNKNNLSKNKILDPNPEFDLQFNNAHFKFLPNDNSDFFHNSIDMFSSDQRIKYENSGRDIYVYKIKKDEIYNSYNIFSSKPIHLKTDFKAIQFQVVNNLLLFLKGKKCNLCDIKRGFQTLKVLNDIKEQLKCP